MIFRLQSFALVLLAWSDSESSAQSASQSSAPALEVRITNLRTDSGVVLIDLDTEASWFKARQRSVRSVRVTPQSRAAKITLDSLPPGRYAIRVHHDENGDGRLNTGLFKLPKERYGFSGNPGGIGPPPYAKAAFLHDGRGIIEIRLR
jgi:uncharacterized protein (DUF2141 family)